MRLVQLSSTLFVLGLANAQGADLLLSGIPTPIRLVVYELPDLPAEQAGLVAGNLRGAFAQAEIVDATATAEDQLREKLKRPFVLFTLLDPKAKLLPQMARRLPLRLEGGILKWNDFSGPAREHRVLFTVPNPFGEGQAAVFAAGTFALLRGGNTGNHSYEIHNSAGPVRTGTYDENLAPTGGPKQLSADDWRADLAFLAKELPARHYKAFHTLSRDDFERRMRELDTAIPKMTSLQIRAAIVQLVAAIGDGHTWAEAPRERKVPAAFREFAEGLFVVRAGRAQAEAMGARVVAIDGMPVTEVRKRLTPFVARENDHSWLDYVQHLSNATMLEAAGVIRSQAAMEVTLEKGGRTFTLRVASESASAPEPRWAPLPFDRPTYLQLRGNYWFEYLPASRTLYINYSACEQMQALSFATFAELVLEQVEKQPPETVVYDLRRNGGGNSAIWAPFFRAVRETPALRPQGRTYVVVGRNTFSSGMLNALELKQQVQAIVAGEPTTERPNHYGEVRRLQLPKSGVWVSYSTKHFRFVPGDPPALMPDLPVAWTAADYFAGRDAVLEAIARRGAGK